MLTSVRYIPSFLYGHIPFPWRWKRLPGASPQVPRMLIFIRWYKAVDASDFCVKFDRGEEVEVSSICLEVLHYFVVIRKSLGHWIWPCKIRELVKTLGRLELSRFDGLAPHSPYAAPGLKYNGFKTIFQSVLACKQSTNSGADDCNLLLHFWSRREDGEARKR